MQGDVSKGVLLAIAIILLWLAGVSFWVAFTGATGQTNAGGGLGEIDTMIHDVTGGGQ
jgi:hypothetical protein